MPSELKSAAQSASAHISKYANEKIVPLPYKPISGDSHVTEPPNCYVDFIEAKYKDTAPHMIKTDKGDFFVVEGFPIKVNMGTLAAAGVDPSKLAKQISAGTFADVPAGGYDAKARVAAQDKDGIGGEIMYPTLGMMICNHPDPDYKRACMDAYNRWLLTFQEGAPDRIFGVGQVPVQSVKQTIKDIENLRRMGFRGVMMPGDPATDFDYDDPQFDELWEAVSDMDVPLSFHILTTKADTKSFAGQPSHRGKAKANFHHAIIRGNQDIISMFIWARIFERFPKLKLVCVEADAGWAPHFMYRLDHFYNKHRFWSAQEEMARMPSDYFRENVYLTFQDDFVAFSSLDFLNPNRLLWANDFPHVDSTWPWSQQLISKQTAHIADGIKKRILRDNVAELYKIN
jgi:predicted TIM-barrel fold metal-dependent hydrolase